MLGDNGRGVRKDGALGCGHHGVPDEVLDLSILYLHFSNVPHFTGQLSGLLSNRVNVERGFDATKKLIR